MIDGLGRHVYVSTYCQHRRCGDCRKTCKTCDAPCRCGCHDDDAQGEHPDVHLQ